MSGTCGQTSTDCAIVGQACSSANPCCPGYACVITGTFTPCDDNSPCTCWTEGPV
jgi:hypothetical protein